MPPASNSARSLLLKAASYARERRIRIPSLPFFLSPTRKKARTLAARQAVQQIRREGIVKLPGFVIPEWLADMQAGLQRMVARSDSKYEELQPLTDDPERYEAALVTQRKSTYTDQCGSCYYDPSVKTYACQDGFQFSEGLARFVMSDELLAIINSYYRKQAFLTRASLHRMMPMERPPVYGWAWHHDGWGRKVNAQILLSDVGEEDQHMAYKKGSHRDYRGLSGLVDATFTAEEVERGWSEHETLRCVGKAGDVFIFDSNGVHCAVSTMGRKRDNALIMTYTNSSFIYGQTLPEDLTKGRSREDLRVLSETLKYNEARTRAGSVSIFPRNGRNWTQSLKYVREWLF